MKNYNRVFAVIVLFLSTMACSTPYRSQLEDLNVGLTKGEVLEKVGNPRFTKRSSNKDIWIYNFFESDQEFRRNLTFQSGQLVNLSEVTPFPSPKSEIEDAKDMKELEKKVREIKKKNDAGFKDISE